MDKLTDSQIKKALECCTQGRDIKVCWHCPLYVDLETARECCEKLNANTLDLINRLKSENERLKQSVEDKGGLILIETAKAEAYKEFVERLCEGRVSNDNTVILAKCLLKELVGEDNA